MITDGHPDVLCPVCGGDSFIPVTAISLGNWAQNDREIVRHATELPFGRCRTCGHVRILHPCPPDFLAGLYGMDRIQGDDQPANSGAGTLRFCQPEVASPDHLILDLGCGRGALLRCLRQEYGRPGETLIGVDFRSLMTGMDIPFRAADLNRLEAAGLDDLAGRVGFLFCCHVLEHIVDPRRFLRAACGLLRPGGYGYFEVPNLERCDPESLHELPMVNPQHLHHFSARSLRLLVESCGFETVRAEASGVLRLLVRRHDDHGVADTVRLAVDALQRRRRRIAETIAARAQAGDPIAVWGLGADFTQMLSLSPALASQVAAGAIGLFDLLHAGLHYSGQPIEAPEAIGRFDGTVYLLPSIHLVADRMRAYARSRQDWPAGRIADPWREDNE